MTAMLRGMAGAAAVAASLALLSCSSASSGPEKGTPAFYWAAARQTYAAGDYVKTVENLDSIVSTENEYTARARPWLLLLTSGMARGYMEEADYYEAGARINKADPTTFRKQVSQSRAAANRLALRFADTFAG